MISASVMKELSFFSTIESSHYFIDSDISQKNMHGFHVKITGTFNTLLRWWFCNISEVYDHFFSLVMTR